MNDDKDLERIILLQQKWLSNTISPEELKEFNEWFSADKNKEIIIPKDFAVSPAQLEKRMFANIKTVLPNSSVTIYKRLRWIAAACILFVLIGVIYLQNRRTNLDQVETVSINEIKAGYDHAVLKLADGTVVNLDSNSNGTIKPQGNVLVTRRSGTLVYNTVEKIKAPIGYNTIITPRGGQYKIVLDDKTVVWLNSASEIHFPTSFSGSERIVELKGEAFFDVSKNASKPFRVKTDKVEINVLGTEFNINAYENENSIKTTLVTGRINVMAGNDKITLSPGQQAKMYNTGTEKLELVHNVDIDDELSWQKGIFQFRNADLNLIARQLSRWYDVDIETVGDSGNVDIGGGISKKSSLEQILKVLEKRGVKHNWKNKKLVLYAL